MLRTLEKYEILDELGHGGMATVYRARDTRLDRLVALKVMHPHLRASAEARERFTREAQSVAKLRHKNILEIYDYSGEGSEESYIATELLTGPTLKVFAEGHPDIPPEIAASIAIEIAGALGEAHAQGVIHRDVKPENVLLHQDGTVKLTDFGIAHMRDSQSFTATGQILGSPGHMAPEQVEGGEISERTDLFSLGTVLYLLACGRLPFGGRNPHQVLKQIAEGRFQDPQRARPAIGARLAAIVSRALALAPADRYATAKELEEALRAFLQELDIDDPEALLARYFASPDDVSVSLRARILARLLALGKDRARSGDHAGAIAHLNRVLAIDEANVEALAVVGRLGRRSRVRRGALVASLGAVALAAGAWAWSALGTGGAGVPDAGLARADAGATSALPSDARPPLADAGVAPSSRDGAVTAPDAGGVAPPPRGPRMVVFRPEPQNVSIGIDGVEPRPFGPAFHEIELPPGLHRFRFVSGSDCCDDVEFAAHVPPGSDSYVLRRRLAFRPARLYVIANALGRIAIVGGPGSPITGRTREVVSVPLQDVEEVRTITVTAAGYRDYTTSWRLRAGQLLEQHVELERTGPSP